MSDPEQQEERIWLVDKEDRPLDEGWQIRDGKKNWQNFRVVNAFVKNRDGKIWIPRRASHKRLFPDCLDMSMGGHVDWPESYEDALRHELMEELNLDDQKVSMRFLGHLTPAQHPVLSAAMKVWEIEMDETPNFNPDDFTEAYWHSPAETLQRIKDGDRAKGDLVPLIKIFYNR